MNLVAVDTNKVCVWVSWTLGVCAWGAGDLGGGEGRVWGFFRCGGKGMVRRRGFILYLS